jgi:heme-degrading monooxygenase HmoA
MIAKQKRRTHMYGSIAKMKVKPGKAESLNEMMRERGHDPGGAVSLSVFQMDADPSEIWVVAISESREAYRAYSESPESHETYLKMRESLEDAPEWHDGEVIRHEHR